MRRATPRQLDLPAAAMERAPIPPPPARRRGDLVVALAAIAGGIVFFSSLGRIWPLAQTDLTVPSRSREREARSFLLSRGQHAEGFLSASRLVVDEPVLDYIERRFDRERAQTWIAEGLPIVTYRVVFKRAGDPDDISVTLHPTRGVVGWTKGMEEDEPGQRIGVEQARALAQRELTEGLSLDLKAWSEKAVSTRELPARRDHTFVYERTHSESPELRERVVALVAGSVVVGAHRHLVVPGPARREAVAREAPAEALQAFGVVLLAAAAVGAFVVFLRRLREGSARLDRAGVWVGVLVVTQIATQLLQTARLHFAWQTLWPRWVSSLQMLVYDSAGMAWMCIVLLAFLAAGEALDREAGTGRGESLWALGRGRFLDGAVAAASGRGFLVGLLCGGILSVGVLALEALAGARTAIQPRGFFFYALNSASPSASTLLFFLNVALVEELGYRFFGGTWLLTLTRRRWLAVLAPALIYGLTHTTLDFLPPAEPFWARPLVLTLVGCVWGWAFLRYDALTVILSHFTADLFIFNWPRLASGKLGTTTAAVLVVCVPLLPAALWETRRWLRSSRTAP